MKIILCLLLSLLLLWQSGGRGQQKVSAAAQGGGAQGAATAAAAAAVVCKGNATSTTANSSSPDASPLPACNESAKIHNLEPKEPGAVLTTLIPLADLQDEEAAFLFRRVLFGSLGVVKRSLRLIAKGVRGSGDTLAGLMSGVIKATGGVFNLLADALSEISLPLVRPRAPTDRMPHSIDHLGRRIGRGLRGVSRVLFAIGESCILAGETAEVLTVGLGQSVEESFLGLELVASTIQRGGKQLLTPRRRLKQPGGVHVWYTPRGRVPKGKKNESVSLAVGGQQQQHNTTSEKPNIGTASKSVDSKRGKASPTVPADPPPAAQSPYPDFIAELNERFHSQHTEAELSSDEDSVSAYKVLLAAFGAWILEPFSFRSAAGLNPPSISVHVLSGMAFIALMSSATYVSKRRRILVLLCCCLLVWAYLMAMDTVIRKKVESRVSVRAVGTYLREQMDEHERAKKKIPITPASPLPRRSAERFFETSVWLNVLIGSLWNLDGYGANPREGYLLGGLGPYIGEMWEAMLNEQLALVPQGVANLQLKRFSLGRQAPIIKAVRFDGRRDVICLAPGASASVSSALGGASLQDRWRAFQDRRDTLPPSSVAQTSAACQHLVADIDLSYLSQDMDIVFTLRSPDVHSVLPEATVRLSEISLSGTLRIDAELTPDYPFVGNATISFLKLPVLDTSISSFGGVDLASIPGVYTWINITMTWLLGQFTSPQSATVDLRRNICPSCDGKPAPSTSEALQAAAEALRNGIKEGVERAWSTLQAVRRRRSESSPSLSILAPTAPPLSPVRFTNTAGNETDTATPAAATTSLLSHFQDLLLGRRWSNGTVAVLCVIILFLCFRLLRKPGLDSNASATPAVATTASLAASVPTPVAAAIVATHAAAVTAATPPATPAATPAVTRAATPAATPAVTPAPGALVAPATPSDAPTSAVPTV